MQATYSGKSYFGFANYWGINFQGLDLNAISDAAAIPGLTVADQRPNNTTTYTLGKNGGKLTKWTQVTTTLGALDGIPFTYGADLSAVTTPAVPSGWNNWVLQWSNTNQWFSVVGSQTCGNQGCVNTALGTPSVINVSAFNSIPVSGYANSYGGNITIPPPSAGPHASVDTVYYYTQATVIPGTAPLTLHCLNQCPTATQLARFILDSSGATTPFGNGTDGQWFSAPNAPGTTVTYSFGANGLTESGSPLTLSQAGQIPANSPYAQNGVQTGNLFTSILTTTNCPPGGLDALAGNLCEPTGPSVYYTWQTGTQQWNQSLWLNAAGAVVPFDPPQNIAYTVPSGAAYGSYAGLPILLQFNGFGNLNGIPGSCVSPVTNAPVPCGPNTNYVPSFSIPDGTPMSLPGLGSAPTTPLIVKALNGEILLKQLTGGQCSAMTLNTLSLPSGGTHDPSSSADSEYLGTMPVVTAAPKVIDGVLQ